jgi:adenine-specific DNA-methyltransferase
MTQSAKYDKLINLLYQMFQMDRADLDFGIYRIMNQRRAEIKRFLDEDLLAQVKDAFSKFDTGNRAKLEQELSTAREGAKALGLGDTQIDELPKIKAILEQLNSQVNATDLENRVYSYLVDFFGRYYDNGDFVSKRRYKEGAYAIPYEGEEVKLYWANYDQFYIKTAENFTNYAFKTIDGKRIVFEVLQASTEQDNNKSQNGSRYFVLARDNFERWKYVIEDDTLRIFFHYTRIAEKRKQDDLNKEAVKHIIDSLGFAGLQPFIGIAAAVPTDGNPNRTLLEKHLTTYTAKNEFDYFIHKDLKGFLERELDFYIKNEIIRIDDLDSENEARVTAYLSQVKVFKSIAKKLIIFLAQLEEFQKKLWLKKKFVVQSDYCMTLDKVEETHYPSIAANQAQIAEWVKLGFIEDASVITVDYLKQHPFLILDTAFFPDLKTILLAPFEDLDQAIDGILINGENFHALNFLQECYRERVSAIYIDPPYNTDASSIIYKNNYKNSSWLTLISDRVELSSNLMSSDSLLCMAIDDEELAVARLLLENSFAKLVGVAVVRSNPQSRKTKDTFSPTHEYALFYGKSEKSLPGNLETTEKKKARYPLVDDKGNYAWMNFIRTGNNDLRSDRPKLYYPIYVSEENNIRIPSLSWNEKKGEYDVNDLPHSTETVVYPNVQNNGVIIEKRWHRGFERVTTEPEEYRIRRSKSGDVSIDFKTRLDEEATPITWWDHSEYASANYGASQLKGLFGYKPFDFPKALKLVEDCIQASGADKTNTIILDYFAGSGTTAHAVINLNREDDGQRKYILVEMGTYFDNVTKPRIQKIIYSNNWKNGLPQDKKGTSHMFKYMKLESYEDTLNNLQVVRKQAQQRALDEHPEFRAEYMLSYMLDIETRDSASLLNLGALQNPFAYKLRVADADNEIQETNVDLVETLNYLLGLHVKTRDADENVVLVTGNLVQTGESVFILWRNIEQVDDESLRRIFDEYKGGQYDFAYVNGDNTLNAPNLRLIEEVFAERMFV